MRLCSFKKYCFMFCFLYPCSHLLPFDWWCYPAFSELGLISTRFKHPIISLLFTFMQHLPSQHMLSFSMQQKHTHPLSNIITELAFLGLEGLYTRENQPFSEVITVYCSDFLFGIFSGFYMSGLN